MADEPLRRRLRAALLRGLGRLAGGPADCVVRGFLATVALGARTTRYHRLARANLALALPELADAERERLLAAMWKHTARVFHEWLVLSGPRGDALLESVELGDSLERLRPHFAAGRGVLLCTAHLGNWEVLAARLRREGFDGAVVGYAKRNDSTADWLVELRARRRVRSLAQDDSPRELLGVLRAGGGLGLLCDLEVKRLSGVWVEFLCRPALTMTAPAALARTARLPLVPLRCVRRDGRYVLSVEEPLELDSTLPREEAELDLLERLNATYSRWIRETPEQWIWYRPRWSPPPADAAARLAARVPLAARKRRGRG